MLQIVYSIASGTAMAVHDDTQNVHGKYPGCIIITPSDGLPVAIGQPYSPSLGELQLGACNQIDSQYKQLGDQAAPPGGDALLREYLSKETQAKAFLLATPPATDADIAASKAAYPLVWQEVGITGATAADVAMAMSTKADQLEAYLKSLALARVTGNAAVEAATDQAGVLAALAAVVWP